MELNKKDKTLDLSNILKVNQEYEYQELCLLLNERVKTGGAKNKQFENWKKYFQWTKPKRTKFLITDIFNNYYYTNKHGGHRDGSGRNPILTDEVEYILNCFTREAKKINGYRRILDNWDQSYFNNDIFSKVFGIYRDFYKGKNDDNVDKKAYKTLYIKIEARRKFLLKKIKDLFKETGEEFTYGIIAFKDFEKTKYEYKDELREPWEEYREEYIKKNRLGFLGRVIENDLWDSMISYISSKFDGYEIVKEYCKISFKPERAKKYDKNKYTKCRKRINDIVIESIYDKCLKKEKKDYLKEQEKIEFQIEQANDIYYYLKENKMFSSDTEPLEEMEFYKELVNSIHDFNEEEAMVPYKYIIDNYVRI